MNSGVPNITRKLSPSWWRRASPKSMILIRLLSLLIQRMFSGFRSRCKMDFRCMYCTPWQIWRMKCTQSLSVNSRSSSATRSKSSPPATLEKIWKTFSQAYIVFREFLKLIYSKHLFYFSINQMWSGSGTAIFSKQGLQSGRSIENVGGDNWTILTIPSRGLCFLLSRKHPTTSEVWGVLVNSWSPFLVANSPSLFEFDIWRFWQQMFCQMFFLNICGLSQIFLWKKIQVHVDLKHTYRNQKNDNKVRIINR